MAVVTVMHSGISENVSVGTHVDKYTICMAYRVTWYTDGLSWRRQHFVGEPDRQRPRGRPCLRWIDN